MAEKRCDASYGSLNERYEWEGKDTPHVCDHCNQHIYWREHAVAICLSYAAVEEDRLEFTPVQDTPGTLMVPGVLLHQACWEEISKELHFIGSDILSVEALDEMLDCCFCNSSICSLENLGAVYYGKFGVGKQGDASFVLVDKRTDTMCIMCCKELGALVGRGDWEEASESGECHTCSTQRCWRNIECTCECHEEYT